MSTTNFFTEYNFKILLIEDKFSDIREVFENVYNIEIMENKTAAAKKKNSNTDKACIFVFNPNNIKDFLESIENKRFDLFLIDLNLGKDRNFSGRDILNEFKKKYPDVPVFVFTWTFSKDEIIREIKEFESDGFIHKSEIRELEKIIKNYYENNFGEIWHRIRKIDKEMAYHLRKCILTWRRNPKLLWHGDKAMNLVDHAFRHSDAMYNLLDELLKLDNFNQKEENLYYLSMAIWVHDIGLKGYKDAFLSYEIRKKHPIISGYLIDKYPCQYLLNDSEEDKNDSKEDKNDSEEDKNDSKEDKNDSKEDKINKIKKSIALISTYHLFAAPLTKDFLQIDRIKEKALGDFKYPTKYDFLNKYAEENNKLLNEGDIITLEIINKDLVIPAALLRFLDVVDKGFHRVGVYEEEDVKYNVCFEDANILKKELDEEIKKISEQIGFLKYTKEGGESYNKLVSFTIDLERIIDLMQKYFRDLIKKLRYSNDDNDKATLYFLSYNYFTNIKKKKDEIVNEIKRYFVSKSIERVIILLDQIFFHLETPLHFITHRTFSDKVDFKESKVDSQTMIDIYYYFNQDFINVNEGNLNFANFNRLFQEAWKIFADIQREYQPLKDILNNKFCKVLFILENKDKPLFKFDLNGKYAEKQFIIYFDTKKEKEDFIKEFFEKILKINVNNKKCKIISIKDEFFDVKENENWILKSKKWFFRKRTFNRKVIWGIKIEPLYWKGEYENKIEITCEGKGNDRPEKAFENLLESEPFNSVKFDLNKGCSFMNLLGDDKKLVQKRKEYDVKFNKIPIKVFEGKVALSPNQNKEYYFLEIEANKDIRPWQQEKVIEDLLENIRISFPKIKVETKSKLDYLLEN